MIVTWSPEELNSICSAVELHIAIRRSDGRLRRWTPIWVVCVDEQVYVRTWYRRETGWFGHALLSRRARCRPVTDGPAPLVLRSFSARA